MTGLDDGLLWVAAANAVIWIGFGFYVAFLARRQGLLARRCKQMELWRNGTSS